MNTILVTGGAGFIGSNLCEKLLQQDYRIVNIDNFNNYYNPLIKRNNIIRAFSNPNYKLIEGDIRNQELLDAIFKSFNIDTVIHLAAVAGVRRSIEDPVEYIDIDIKGTVILLELCKKYKINKLIFASSSSVYGLNNVPFREDSPLDGQLSPYAASKFSGEQFCRTYNILYNIPTVCLRFFTVYGPRQRPDMAIYQFTKLIDEGKEISVYGDGTSSRDYTYIDDITNGISAAINLDCNFEIFNLGNSESVNIIDLVKIIEKRLGKKAKFVFTEMQAGDVAKTFADISKPRRLLGYDPKISITEGIDKFVDWYENKDI